MYFLLMSDAQLSLFGQLLKETKATGQSCISPLHFKFQLTVPLSDLLTSSLAAFLPLLAVCLDVHSLLQVLSAFQHLVFQQV